MIVANKNEIINKIDQIIFGFKIKQIKKLVFKRVEKPLHWSIIIGATGAAHALYDIVFGAKFNKTFGCKLAALIGVKDDFSGFSEIFKSRFKRFNGKPGINFTRHYRCDNRPIIQVKDGAVIAFLTI